MFKKLQKLCFIKIFKLKNFFKSHHYIHQLLQFNLFLLSNKWDTMRINIFCRFIRMLFRHLFLWLYPIKISRILKSTTHMVLALCGNKCICLPLRPQRVLICPGLNWNIIGLGKVHTTLKYYIVILLKKILQGDF
jgi:hypothetical protein